MTPRQSRRVKKIIISKSKKRKIIKIVPASRLPVLRYHGIEPENLVAIDLDVYLPTGERDGQEYKYHKTILDIYIYCLDLYLVSI